MPLSEEEQRILQQIEDQFHRDKPGRRAAGVGSMEDAAEAMKRAGLIFAGGLVGLIAAVSFVQPFIYSLVAVAVMLVAGVLFDSAATRMGHAGWTQLFTEWRGEPRSKDSTPTDRDDSESP